MTRREAGKETEGGGTGQTPATTGTTEGPSGWLDHAAPGGPVPRGSWPRRQPAAVNHRALFPPRPPALLGRRTSNTNQPDPQTEPGGTPLTAASRRPQGEIKPMACNMDTRKSSAFRVKIRCSVTTQRGWMGWEMGTHVYLWLIHVDVWQKATQYCKAIILQFKKKILKTMKRMHICV